MKPVKTPPAAANVLSQGKEAEPAPDQPLVPPSETPFVETTEGPVGKNIHKIDGMEKVVGTALFGADLFKDHADLFAKVVRSDLPHANIKNIDVSAALKVPGVVGVHTAKDVKGTNLQGLILRDHPALATDRVRYRGDALAVVVATTEAVAIEGRDTVKVAYEPLPVISSMDQALAPDACKIHPHGNIMGGKRIRRGDVEKALADSDVVVSDTFHTQTVDHAFLDLEAGVARWDGSQLVIQASGQWVHEERRLVALALGLQPEQIRIIQPQTGGAFGGREDISIQIYLGLAALQHPNKGIALRYTREESMRARHKRHALRIQYTLGATREGKLTAAKVIVHSDEGAYASTGPAVMRKASSHATGPYLVPTVHVDVYGVFTNNNPTGAMRGFGACQMAVAYNGIMDRLAGELGMDRVELHRRNLIRSGDPVTTGQRIPIATIVECLDAALKQFNSKPAPPEPAEPHLKRGWGISTMCFGLGYGDGFPDCSRAHVKFQDDGRLTVYTGAVDFGQGVTNVVAQIAAEMLHLPMERVEVVAADTELTEESGSSSATRQTFFTGNAVYKACTELKEQLLDVASKTLAIHPHEIKLENGCATSAFGPGPKISIDELLREGRKRGYPLEVHALFKPRTVCEDFETGQSPRSYITYLFGAHVSQVLVDTGTGEVRVERHIGCHDVGKAINPMNVRGQIAGGVAQGIGMALMEEVVMKDGRIMNPGFTDYVLPTIHDVPPVECVILETDDPEGPYGARGIGEPPLIGAVPAVLSAIYDATGVAPRRLPCTPERVWQMLQDSAAESEILT